MYPELQTLLYEAEERYLESEDLELLKVQVVSLKDRMVIYESLRENEIAIFQPIANRLEEKFNKENPNLIEKALQNWLSIMRYCAMAMLLNNPEFLQRRLLEWLEDIVKVYQTESIEKALYQLLQTRLQKILSQEQMALLNPYLKQAKTTLLDNQLENQNKILR